MRAQIRGIELIYEIDEAIPEKFTTDSQRLKQILQNLISNAMKFTSKGHIKTKAELIQINDKDAIKFSVTDTGFGIKKEDQESLFQLFTTLD